MSEWKSKCFADAGIVVIDGDRGINYPKDSDFSETGDCLFLNAKNVTKNGFKFTECIFISKEKDGLLGNGKLNRNDIVITTRGTVGNIAQYKNCVNYENIRINSGMAILRNTNIRLDQEYISHFLNSQLFYQELNRVVFGSAQPQLTVKIINNFILHYPLDTTEQRKIARILSTIDSVIERTEAAIAKYTAIKQGMMHNLFTRGIDLKTGKLRPKYEDAPEMYWKTELGWVPKEWEVVQLHDACIKIQDGTHFSPQSQTGPFMYVTSKNIRFGFMDLIDVGWISEKEHRGIYSRCDVKKGDILLTKDGANTGNVAFNNIAEEFSLLSSVALLRCDEIIYHNYFLFHCLLSPKLQQVITDLMSGNAITRLTLTKINAINVPQPPYAEQHSIADKLNSIHKLQENEKVVLEKYIATKNALMSALLTGRKRVKYTEKTTEVS